MKGFDPLRGYPEPKQQRFVGPRLRTIQNRIVASYRGQEFYDGDRNNGYGGLKYDGRWMPVAKAICEEYKLDGSSSVLQIGCDKGFLLHEFLQLYPSMKVQGLEVSDYAIQNAMPSVKPLIQKGSFVNLPFGHREFDYVVAMGVVYSLNLPDAIQSLKEIKRVGKGRSFITLASYETERDFWLFRHWTLLGTTVLKKEEWIEVLNHVGYEGDYKFTSAQSLNLAEEVLK